MSSTKGPFRLERVRSFGTVFSDTKRILRENLAAFLGVLVFVIGPVVLITTTVNVYYEKYLFDGEEFYQYQNFGSYLGILSLLAQTRSLFNGLFAALVISHFLKVCREKGSGRFTVSDITASMWKDALGGLILFVVLFLLCTALGICVVAILYWIASESGAAMAGLMIFFGAVGYLLIRYPFWHIIFSIFMSRGSTIRKGNEEKQPSWFESISLSTTVMAGQWWRTWAIMFCMWALLFVVGYLITITSSFGGQLLDLFNLRASFDEVTQKMVDTILEIVSNFARTLVNVVFSVAVGLHFYSTRESKYGHSISEQLDKIGKSSTNDDVELSY